MTIASIILSIAIIPQILAVIISYNGLKQTKYVHYTYLISTWFFLSLGTSFLTLAYIFLDKYLYRIAILCYIPLTYSIMLLVDSISIKRVDPYKLFLITLVSTLLVITATDSNAVIESTSGLGEVTLALNGNFLLVGIVIYIIASSFWFYYMLKIYINAPQQIKKDAFTSLLGATFAGPGSALLFVPGIVWILPGIDYLFIGIGALLTSYAFVKQPKLGYILQFNVYQLTVIQADSGIAIYDYIWDGRGIVNSMLFSSTLHAISGILDESVGKGRVKEIRFDQALLLIKTTTEDDRFIFSLLTNKSNTMLFTALSLFARRFANQYKEIKDLYITSEFENADKILEDTFPFVVSRTNTEK